MKSIKKKMHLVLFALTLALCLTLLPAGQAHAVESGWDGMFPQYAEAAGFSGGNGFSAATAFEVGTARDLAQLCVNVNAGKDYAGMYFKLTSDIDLNNHPWVPIGHNGNEELLFRGSFDGGGHIVRNITITSEFYYTGLFGCIDGQTAGVSNLGVVDCNIISTDSEIGCLAGTVFGAQITNCYATGDIATNGLYVGGLLGDIAYDSVVTDCHAAVTIKGEDYIGGLIGYATSDSIVIGCHASGDVSGTDFVGGLIGYAADIKGVRCYATGDVVGERNIGGLAGRVKYGSFINCYATGNVTCGNVNAGGLLGYLDDGAIASCFATGNVTGDYAVGGLVGHITSDLGSYASGIASNCYASGSVLGCEFAGGLAGIISYDSKAENCYATGDVALVSEHTGTAGGLIGALWHDGAIIRNCVALNPSISVENGYAFRVSGGSYDDNITNCFAWDGMRINIANAGPDIGEDDGVYGINNSHGESITRAEALTVAFWHGGDQNSAPDFGEAWYLADGKLPKLYALDATGAPTKSLIPGQKSDIPSHLRIQSSFVDVPEGKWFYDYVIYMCERELMLGTSDTTFSPDENLSRAMLVTILWRASGSPEADLMYADFSDVLPGSWYEKAVAWAVKNSIATGYGEGLFGPDDPIKREQLVTMLYRFADSPELTSGQLEFGDTENISDWAFDAFVWATEKEIMTGNPDGLLIPQGTASRAEAAALLTRFLSLS